MSDLYERLLAASGPLLAGARYDAQTLNARMNAVRAVLKRHEPSDGRCTECVEWCDCLALDDEARVANCPHGNVSEPCPTVRAIARALDVPIGDEK